MVVDAVKSDGIRKYESWFNWPLGMVKFGTYRTKYLRCGRTRKSRVKDKMRKKQWQHNMRKKEKKLLLYVQEPPPHGPPVSQSNSTTQVISFST